MTAPDTESPAEGKELEERLDEVETTEQSPEKKEVEVEPRAADDASAEPAESTDAGDDLEFLKKAFVEKLIQNQPAKVLARFAVECEGKSVREKDEWMAKHGAAPKAKLIEPSTDKKLPVGSGGPRPSLFERNQGKSPLGDGKEKAHYWS